MFFNHLEDLDLRQVCYFLSVVEAGNNISRAAERLNMEQASLTQRIRALEKTLKIKLFDRSRRPLILTPAGTVFWEAIQPGLTQIDHAIAQAQRAQQGEIGQLTMGISSSIYNSILPEILKTFRRRFPNITLELRELALKEQHQQLSDRQLDIGFAALPNIYEQDSNLCFYPVLEESLVIVLPENHPLADQAQIPLKALKHEHFLLPSLEVVPFYQQVIDLCKQAGFQPQLANATANWMVTILSLVAAEQGIAILPESALNLHRKGVIYRPIQDYNLTRKVAAVWHKDNALSSAVLQGFLQVLQAFKQPDEAGAI
jgi:DNA-binding transcriptional LysR family regulator